MSECMSVLLLYVRVCTCDVPYTSLCFGELDERAKESVCLLLVVSVEKHWHRSRNSDVFREIQ